MRGDESFQVWGTGKPLREFLYSDDLADACIFLLEEKNAEDIGEIINIGTGQEVSVRQLAALVSEVVGFEGKQSFDPSKPDGTPRKLLDSSRLSDLGWRARTTLTEGLRLAYGDFLNSKWA
jgi:GDP-L-fucose synthase